MFGYKESYLKDCQLLIGKVKYVAESWDWVEKPTKSNTLIAGSSLLDADFVTLRGLRLWGRYQIGETTGFSYFHLGIGTQRGLKGDVCRLDVHPFHERSHKDRIHGILKGPHFHCGDCSRKVDVEGKQHRVHAIHPDFEIENLDRWIALFKERARVLASKNHDIVSPPVEHDLFGPRLQ